MREVVPVQTEPWVREAIDAGLDPSEIEVDVQPVVELGSGSIVGAESFVRWHHPTRGRVGPRTWLPYALTSGAYGRLVNAYLPAWIGASGYGDGPVVSYNVDGHQLADDTFVAALLAVPSSAAAGLALEIWHHQFDRAGVAARDGWVHRSVPDIAVRIERLRRHGYEIWIDDVDLLSTGWEGVHDVDVVKLDRSLLAAPVAALDAIVGRAHGRGERVLIEGVETEEHVAIALEAEIDLAQGFFYAAPMTIEEFLAASA